ncbi:hypothetical protein BDR04DRAFT_1235208 [Suillus decipiens]|nr:hypothetical protein BDR04DRAFT_1235208 [Suillus decipiens]
MVNNTGASAPKTPLHHSNSTFSADIAPQLEAVDSDVISKCINTPFYILSRQGPLHRYGRDPRIRRNIDKKTRRALGLRKAERRSRVLLNIVVSRQLLPITRLTGDELLAAWWKIVMSHRTLWENDVRHGDISLSNLMGYRIDGRFISVLNDFDLSSTEQNDTKGLERTGTVPFMSLRCIIPKAIANKVKHAYYHDAESFIWVLTWICLRYENGSLLSRNRLLDEWLKVDATRCHEKETSYLSRVGEISPMQLHQKNFGIAMQFLW